MPNSYQSSQLIRAVLVEDELPSLERLKSLLGAFDDIHIVGEAADGPSAIDVIDEQRPDLVFLDIQLPVYTGFQVLEKISHKPHIIFVTAYDQYAIKAFEENAVDYLLKPMSPERLASAITKARRRTQPVSRELIQLLQSAVNKSGYLERFTVKIGDEVLLLPQSEVVWFQAEDKYVFLHTYDREYIYDATLKQLEKALDPARFIRIHKSLVVSIAGIDKLKRAFSGKYKIHLKDAKKSAFEIGRTFLPNVRSVLDF
ncbi:hypothetical protein A2V82_09700 [candidate division KSB1 bacterium RBG_16_48_16]|nr:MAG: hypothetical protein A2V82_09700 [candidate division KSB1 bacterium RBG_16_48_16]